MHVIIIIIIIIIIALELASFRTSTGITITGMCAMIIKQVQVAYSRALKSSILCGRAFDF